MSRDFFLQLIDEPRERFDFDFADVLATMRISACFSQGLFQFPKLPSRVFQLLVYLRIHHTTSTIPFDCGSVHARR